MKTVNHRTAKEEFERYLTEAQSDHILVTSLGQPKVVMIGVHGLPLEKLVAVSHEELLALLASRPKDSPSSGEEIRLTCSFCGKGQEEVQKLIAGPTVYICDECVHLCHGIIASESE